MQWKPVETAPRDGRLLILPGGVGYFRDGKWWTVTNEAWPGRPIEWAVRWWMPLPPSPDAPTPEAA